MRKKIIAGNWKMNHGPKAAESFLTEFLKLVEPNAGLEWVLIPPSISLTLVAQKLNGSTHHAHVKFGAQNCHFEKSGAFTGEIAPVMLQEIGCHYALVGHSERRQLFFETDATCSKKVRALNDVGIIPMLCVGETQEERDKNRTNEVLTRQVLESLSSWSPEQPLVIAYEPVWAIGTGKVATPQMADVAHATIRALITERAGQKRSSEIQILYGGSVKPDNSKELAMFPNIDGFLVGGASLIPKTFAQIGQIPL
jgi:triosephosphate isomerase